MDDVSRPGAHGPPRRHRRAGAYVLQAERVVPAGVTLAHRWTDLVVDGMVEVYTTESTVLSLTEGLRRWPQVHGPIVIHSVPDDLGSLLAGREEMPAPVVAVDLMDSGDPRSERAGQRLWEDWVRHWRDPTVLPPTSRAGATG